MKPFFCDCVIFPRSPAPPHNLTPIETVPVQTFSPDYAAQHLEDLIARARSGEEIVIAQAGTPVARLVPIQGSDPEHDEAHAPDAEVDEAFHGD